MISLSVCPSLSPSLLFVYLSGSLCTTVYICLSLSVSLLMSVYVSCFVCAHTILCLSMSVSLSFYLSHSLHLSFSLSVSLFPSSIQCSHVLMTQLSKMNNSTKACNNTLQCRMIVSKIIHFGTWRRKACFCGKETTRNVNYRTCLACYYTLLSRYVI